MAITTYDIAFTENPTFKTVTGLTNKTWSGTATSGRAATEDQLAAALPVVAAGTGIDSVTPTASQGKTTYTVNAHEYEVTTSDPNIIITVTTA